jgi:hypothetical protein
MTTNQYQDTMHSQYLDVLTLLSDLKTLESKKGTAEEQKQNAVAFRKKTSMPSVMRLVAALDALEADYEKVRLRNLIFFEDNLRLDLTAKRLTSMVDRAIGMTEPLRIAGGVSEDTVRKAAQGRGRDILKFRKEAAELLLLTPKTKKVTK